jgi:pimeloyl-ACP methyl ester carboxylesterase
MTAARIILVPGFWLGAWAWDEVAEALRGDGHDVTAITLPGLASANADRSSITLEDHVQAIVDAVDASPSPVVLVVHSASGFAGYAATDRVPKRIAAVVYVDSAPGVPPMEPGFEGVEKPLDWSEVESQENLDGLTEEHKARFRRRAVPVPGGVLRGTVELTNEARTAIPSTILCTSYPAAAYQRYASETDAAWLAGIGELRDITWIDLPTSHWPMWSRPSELARIIDDIATSYSSAP